jgi:[heparan sulfate]-glucosamine 3-sulfotransferase 3
MPLSNDFQITMEKTPKYLIDNQVPQRVYSMNPEIKLIIVLRNPVTRAISEYVQSQWRKKRKVLENAQYLPNFSKSANLDDLYIADSKKFRQMLYKENSTEIRSDWTIVRNGIYINSIKQWLKYFSIEQILFVNGERLISEPHVELEKVQLFLNLNPVIKKEHFVHDRRKGFACIIKPIDSKQVKCLNEQKGRKHPVIENSVLQELASFYKPFNEQLFELLNQKPWWPV